jgi:hypothetical protein
MKFIRFVLKFFKWSFIFLASALALFFIYFLIQTKKPDSYDKMSSQDQKTFTYLSKVYSAFEKNPAQIWDNTYKFQKEPLILLSKKAEKGIHQSIYLINMSSMINTSKYQKVSFPAHMNLDDVYVTSWYGIKLLPQWFINFNFIDIDDKSVMAFSVNPTQLKEDNPFNTFPYFMPHEAFHEYKQMRDGWLYDNPEINELYGEHIENYPHTKEHYTLLREEYALLDSAINQLSNKEQLAATMKKWIEIREQRYKKWPNLKHETNSETMEGTAMYIEQKLYEAGIYPISSWRAIANEENPTVFEQYKFNQVMDMVDKFPGSASNLERRMSYDKGTALALILDVLDKEWKNKVGKVQNKKMPTLYDLVKESVKTNE